MARLRFANRYRVCGTVGLPVEEFSSDGEVCLNRLCQPKRTSSHEGSEIEPSKENEDRELTPTGQFARGFVGRYIEVYFSL